MFLKLSTRSKRILSVVGFIFLAVFLYFVYNSYFKVSDQDLVDSYAQKLDNYYDKHSTFPRLLTDLEDIDASELKARQVNYIIKDSRGVEFTSYLGYETNLPKGEVACAYSINIQKTSLGLNSQIVVEQSRDRC